MEEALRKAMYQAAESEPFSRALNMELKDLEAGYAVVEMTYEPQAMNNIYARAHGGVIFALIDEAFQFACNAHGSVAVALNVNTTFVSSPEPGARLRAEAREVSLTRKTATYDIKVTDQDGRLMALCQALAYRTGKPIPFL